MTQATVPPQAGPAPAKTDPLAIWSLVLGILAFMCCCIPFVPSVLAVVLGGQSREKIRASGGTLTGEGLAQAGVILGWIGIALDVAGCIIGMIIGVLCVMGHMGF
jgi:thiol:disulfide interchange protein